MIEIFDDVLDKENASYIHNCVERLSWKFEYQQTTHLLNKHWCNDFPVDGMIPTNIWHEQLFKDIVDRLELRGIDSIKAQYCLGHTFGLEQQAHYDACDFTMIYYPKLDWQPEWGGGTMVDCELVQYIGNRLVIFDANLPHKAMPVSRQCYELRTNVVFKCHV